MVNTSFRFVSSEWLPTADADPVTWTTGPTDDLVLFQQSGAEQRRSLRMPRAVRRGRVLGDAHTGVRDGDGG